MTHRPLFAATVLALGAMLASAPAQSAPSKAAPTKIAAPQFKPAPASQPVHLSASDKALVDKAAAYLGSLKSAQARFSQTDPRGAVTTGQFSLQRPGRARFAYDAPADLTVVADGANVNVYDSRLKTFDQYPLKQTPLALLLGDNVRFDRAVVVTAVDRVGAGFIVTVRDPKKEAEGKLSLNFSASPMALSGWTVIDGQGMRTTVKLEGLKPAPGLDAKLFVLRDPRPASAPRKF